MTIVDFYKKLSKILEQTRELILEQTQALYELNELLKEAEKSGLDININESILDLNNLKNFDDERSFDEQDIYDSNSYDSDNDYDGYESESSF